MNPLALLTDNGIWYVVGEDLDDKRRKKFRVSRIRGDIRFATRRERDFRTPTDFDIDEYRGRPPWQIGDLAGEARIEVTERHRLVGRARLRRRPVTSRTTSSSPSTRRSRCSPRGCCARTAARVPVEPPALRREVARALRAVQEAHRGEPPALATRGAGARRPRTAPSAPQGR